MSKAGFFSDGFFKQSQLEENHEFYEYVYSLSALNIAYLQINLKINTLSKLDLPIQI